MCSNKKYPWQGRKPYNDYSSFIKRTYAHRVQKISINAGFTCPNRDGTIGRGGCTYCNNVTFKPSYCKPDKSINQQINQGIAFFSKKYKSQLYMAYFQSYTNTYADIELLKKIYSEALENTQIIGLIIGTRPDCISTELLEYLKILSKNHKIIIELGIESTKNETLEITNRCHTFQDSKEAILKISDYGFELGVHLILGLPNETNEEIINHAKLISKLPITSIKLHHLQIIKGTKMAKEFSAKKYNFPLYSIPEYIDLAVQFIENLNPNIVIERFISESPNDLIISPNWNGIKNYEISSKIEKYLIAKNSFQGILYTQTT